MEESATVSFVGVPGDWELSKTIVGVWSELGIFTSGFSPKSNKVCIPIQGRFIVRKWRFVFLAEEENKELFIWKGAPVDRLSISFAEGRKIPFRFLEKWVRPDPYFEQLAESGPRE